MKTDNNNMDRAISSSERMKIKAKRYVWYGVAAVALGVGVWAISTMVAPSVSNKQVTIAKADRGTIDISVTATGNVIPAFEEVITSPITSRILEVFAQTGDSVYKGMPLIRLDLQSVETEYSKSLDEQEIRNQQMVQLTTNAETHLSDMRMRIATEEMRMEQLESQLKNELYLDSLGSGTKDRVRQAETTLKTAQLQLSQLRQQYENETKVKEAEYKMQRLRNTISDKALAEQRRTLEGANIKVPRTATLTYVNNEIGAMVGAGTKVAVISDLSHFKVECTISDSHSEKVKIGGKVLVKTGREMMEGTIVSINPLSKSGSISFIVTMKNPSHPKLHSGLRVEVYVITCTKDEVIRLKNGSFYSGPGEYTLFIKDENNALTPRKIKAGECNYEYVEVVSGLEEGDEVVISNMEKYKGLKKINLEIENKSK